MTTLAINFRQRKRPPLSSIKRKNLLAQGHYMHIIIAINDSYLRWGVGYTEAVYAGHPL